MNQRGGPSPYIFSSIIIFNNFLEKWNMGEAKSFGMWYDTYKTKVSTLLENMSALLWVVNLENIFGGLRKEIQWHKTKALKWLGTHRLTILVEKVICLENIICKFDK